jgi:predicted thioesterase
MTQHSLKPGLTGELETTVDENNVASHVGSGNAAVFATPAMITLMERASVAAVDSYLPDGQTTVGIEVNVHHLAATPLGMKVRARSELLEIDGRWLTFRVEAFDEAEKIGEGSHRRAIIDVERFLAKVAQKA